ncbi:hypothetical protein Gohar_010132, partial [Gossypium harknessii]|nr:hypothetical protein [Gossypium harknessii]
MKKATNVWVFIFIIIVNVAFSQKTNCTLDFEFKGASNSSNENGDWGGFLNQNHCGTTFNGYLKALGVRANQTGFIFLDSSEQTRCLNSMRRFDCGMEKLTSGGGGCSNYSTAEVEQKLGNELRSLSENCRFASCGSCVRSWESINGGSNLEESMICRFAVLVSLTSLKVEDEENIQRIYECLSNNTRVYG